MRRYCEGRGDSSGKSKNVKQHEGKPSVQIAKSDIKEWFKKPPNVEVGTLEFIAPTVKSKTKKKIKEIFENEEPHIDLAHMKNVEGIDREIYVYHFLDATLPYMIMDTIERKVDCLHKY